MSGLFCFPTGILRRLSFKWNPGRCSRCAHLSAWLDRPGLESWTNPWCASSDSRSCQRIVRLDCHPIVFSSNFLQISTCCLCTRMRSGRRCWRGYAEHYPLFALASICGYSALGHRPECASLRCSVHRGTKDSARTANWDCLRECQGRQKRRASSQRWSLSGNCVCLVAIPSSEVQPSSLWTHWVQYALPKTQPYLGSRVSRP